MSSSKLRIFALNLVICTKKKKKEKDHFRDTSKLSLRKVCLTVAFFSSHMNKSIQIKCVLKLCIAKLFCIFHPNTYNIIIFLRNSWFTLCGDATPHTHFGQSVLAMIPHSWVVHQPRRCQARIVKDKGPGY